MKMEPRQQLLEVWEATVRMSWRDGVWHWGGRDGRNSIADAEQLLCLLMPATQLGEIFGIDRPDATNDEILEVLERLGNQSEVPRRLASALIDYFQTYREDGRPVFSGGTYFGSREGREAITKQQSDLDIVDSYAMSITLSLASIGFARVFQNAVTRDALRDEIRRLGELASERLSAAMVGLLRSFTISVLDMDDPEGRILVETINKSNEPRRVVVNRLRERLRQTVAAFREVTIGSGQLPDLDVLNSNTRLFQCGWSWGVVVNAPQVETTEKVGEQPEGVAFDSPFLYFTVVTMDAIEDLWSERTRILGLLNDEQQRLARALQLRYDLTRQYWATVAAFGERWPLEDIPWRTTDGEESDYFTLLVTSLAVKGFVTERGSDVELARVGNLLSELANRGRITRRPLGHDPAAELHAPGQEFGLDGSDIDGGPELTWSATEFAPLLLQRTATIASLLNTAVARNTLLELADGVWNHLEIRRLDVGPGRGLWDQPSQAFPTMELRYDVPSWYYTERVVHGLVLVARTLNRVPLRSERLTQIANDLLYEAEHLLDQVLLNTPASGRSGLRAVRIKLDRARQIVDNRPGTSAVLANEVLRQLETLAAAVREVSGGN